MGKLFGNLLRTKFNWVQGERGIMKFHNNEGVVSFGIEGMLHYAKTKGRLVNYGKEDVHGMPSLVDLDKRMTLKLGNHQNSMSVGSAMVTTRHRPQEPHCDFDSGTYDEFTVKPWLAFCPVTNTGMFLQVWKHGDRFGHLVYIPLGKILLLPGDTIHGGGINYWMGDVRLRIFMYFHQVSP